MTAPILTIDVGALVANWQSLARRHAGRTAAVVKADGYGLGASPVASALAAAGCRHFFVATADEGFALAATLPDAWIAVFEGCPAGAEPEFIDAGLIPVLNSLPALTRWQKAARPTEIPLPALLHIDTGMSRLGLDAAEFAALVARPALHDNVVFLYIMSHLISAEQPDAPETIHQAARFAAIAAAFPGVKTSLANSAGMFLGADYASDLARPGLALYGGNPTPGQPNPMCNVVTLSAPILQIRAIEPGDSVGYGATWCATRPTLIATIGVGYADGMPRSLANRMTARLAGHIIPLVGRVSMDLMTFDITDHPQTVPGTMIDLICADHTIDDLAHEAGTIAYEILTSLGRRYRRVAKSV